MLRSWYMHYTSACSYVYHTCLQNQQLCSRRSGTSSALLYGCDEVGLLCTRTPTRIVLLLSYENVIDLSKPHSKSLALLCIKSPMMRPKRPRMAAKISIVKILTKLRTSVMGHGICKSYLQCGIRSIGQSCTTSIDTDADTADKIAHADRQTCPEQRVSSKDVRRRVQVVVVCDAVQL